MGIDVRPTAAEAGARVASLIAAQMRASVVECGRGSLALSGGRTPEPMLRALGAAEIPWQQVHVFQVDERVVGHDDARRNLSAITAAFESSSVPAENVHGMPVDREPLQAGAEQYYTELCAYAGTPPRIDVVHLGVGEDGHTASLVAHDAALEADGDVAITAPYAGVHRMTLTLRALERAKFRVWLITGASKRRIVRRFLDGDPTIVASRVRREADVIVLDSDAAGG